RMPLARHAMCPLPANAENTEARWKVARHTGRLRRPSGRASPTRQSAALLRVKAPRCDSFFRFSHDAGIIAPAAAGTKARVAIEAIIAIQSNIRPNELP